MSSKKVNKTLKFFFEVAQEVALHAYGWKIVKQCFVFLNFPLNEVVPFQNFPK